MSTFTETTAVTATIVPENQRLAFLPKYFGPGLVLMEAEALVFGHLRSLCPEYQGAYWEFYELSNGGLYMAPRLPGSLSLRVEGNGFSGAMSADAAGIVATLFALSYLSFKYQDAPVGSRCGDHYHQLRDFASEHPEARLIFRAID